jgi:hypothetical protein
VLALSASGLDAAQGQTQAEHVLVAGSFIQGAATRVPVSALRIQDFVGTGLLR